MRKRRKQFKKKTASKNALSSHEPKKRFGKKQKRRILIVGLIVIFLFVGLSFTLKYFKDQKQAEEERARRGELTRREAEKIEYDKDGNPIDTRIKTEIHILNVGDGQTVLIKKGSKEVLVDAAKESVVKYLKNHIDGELEYLVTTNNIEGFTAGLEAVNSNFTVTNYIYNNIESSSGEKANDHVIDLGENLRVTVSPGIDGTDADKNAIVKIRDNEKNIYIVGASSAKNLATLKPDADSVLMMVAGGVLNAENVPVRIMRELNPLYFVASTGTELSQDFITNVNKAGAQLYATYISKHIVMDIYKDEVSMNIDYEQQIRPSEENN